MPERIVRGCINRLLCFFFFNFYNLYILEHYTYLVDVIDEFGELLGLHDVAYLAVAGLYNNLDFSRNCD